MRGAANAFTPRIPAIARRARLSGLAVGLALLAPCSAYAETLSTAEFLARQEKWPDLALNGERLRVEGRIESASGPLLKLRKCPLPFRPADESFPDLRRTTRVEATGRIGRRGTDLVFLVSELKELPDDAEVYALKESALDIGDPSDWYDLAAWAAARGEFFEDRFLLRKADEARRKGLALERQSAAGHVVALSDLARRAREFGLTKLSQELTHESLRARWDALRRDESSNLAPLLEEIASLLPGAAKPAVPWPIDLAARYAAEPLALYNGADPVVRPTLERVLFGEVQLAAIERLADPEGANGESIADRIETLLPERPDLAEHYRTREIDYRLAKVESATRPEAIALASRLEERGRNDQARRALASWLAAREASLRKDGPAGLVVAAEDYAAVLGDKRKASELLLEAMAENPKSEDIAERLRRLGYVRVDGVWITKEEAESRPVDPIALAMREGRVAIGMSPEQVRKTLGAPDRVGRAAGVSQVHEAWQYGRGGRGGLVVHFLRYSARDPKEARVVGVAALTR